MIPSDEREPREEWDPGDDEDGDDPPVAPPDRVEQAYEERGIGPKCRSPSAAPLAPISVLYRDEHFWAIDKPAGFATVSERWQPDAETLIAALWREWQKRDPEALKPHVVHRLDKDTPGVLIFACHRDAQVELRRQFQNREVRKTYHALVEGEPEPAEDTIELTLDSDPKRSGKMVASKSGKLCRTHYRVETRFRGVTWIELQPLEGRTHQIRVSLAHRGHPCAIDPFYGSDRPITLDRFKKTKGRPGVLIDRLTLHASQIEIRHPATGRPQTIRAKLPKDLASTLKQLERWASAEPR